MAHAIWSGAINFGLVTIPVKLFTAVRSDDLRFNFLHKKDDGRIFNERHCTVCGEKVEYADLVRGYEYEKGQYVTLGDDDFKSVRPEATQSVEILEFVELDKINPMYFDTPYYLEPEKKGRHAYALLRESLREANKVGIARVVIRSREHLAALKPNGEALVLELMHFADELVAQSDFDFPELKEKVAPAELKVAKMLIDTMSVEDFEPEKFTDEYKEAVMAMIEARVAGEQVTAPETKRPVATNVVNLMDVLQRSLEQSKRPGAGGPKAVAEKAGAKKSAPAAKPKRKKSAA
ncbi:MAG TPA: Ku protein [Candidatus Lustribacter sp.]|jgi:DNA end-binding protein Ku|nr:Ku protein [Candidatus Lustribacter sp.]